MGREIRRVPLDFKWPIDKVWAGFLNPHSGEKCHVCEGYGVSADGRRLEDFFRRLALAAEASLERPEGYDLVEHKKSPTFAEALVYVRRNAPRGAGNKEIMDTAMKSGVSLGTFMDGIQAMNQGLDPDALSDEPPRWPFPDHDPVEVLQKLSGAAISDADAKIVRRIAGVVPFTGSYRPYMAKYVWKEENGLRKRSVALDPSGGMYYPHPYLCEEDGIADVGPTLYTFFEALTGEEQGTFGYNSSPWNTMQAVMSSVGVTKEGWYLCQTCGGDGSPEYIRALRDAWKSTPVPSGDAYQLWEHVSEGSPQSPPFATPEELADWLVENYDNPSMTHEQWLKFINGPGWSVSGISINGGPLVDGTVATVAMTAS